MYSGASIIDISGLSKDFGHVQALDRLDLTVAEGEVHGFLGPNGAGKSTTLRILLGHIRAGSGSVRVFGRDPWSDGVQVRRDTAYVAGDVNLWPNLSGGEVLDLLAGRRGGADDKLRRQLIDEFELDPRRKSRTYSKGNRQKVALIAAFARPARLYILDEPTSGLDPLMGAVFRAQVRRVRDNGATVLLSSHILGEVEQLCTTVTIIRSGTAVETGALDELRHLRRTHFRITGAANPAALALLPGVHDLHTEDGAVEFDAGPADLAFLLARLAELRIDGLTASPPSLESLFLRHYGATESRVH